MKPVERVCIICLRPANQGFQELSQQGFDAIKECCKSWASLNVRKELNERIKDFSFTDGLTAHKTCYSSITHKDAIDNARKQIDKENFEQENIKEKLGSSEKLTQKSKQTSEEETPDRYQGMQSCNSYLFGIIKRKVIIDEQTVDLKELEDILKEKLLLEGVPLRNSFNYRRYIEQILQNEPEISSSIEFLKCFKKYTVIAAKSFIHKAISNMHYDSKNSSDDDHLSTVSKIIRKELHETKSWKFDGDFTTFLRPLKLEQLLKMFIGGTLPNMDLNQKRKDQISLISRNACDYIFSNFKSDRAVKYKSKSESERGFEKTRLSPLTVGTSLLSYINNRSREEIDHLHYLGFGISYDKWERIITGIAKTLIKKSSENEFGVFLPPSLVKGVRPIFAADNVDLGSDRTSFHGADLMVAQRIPNSLKSEKDSHTFTYGNERSLPYSIQQPVEEIFVPVEKNENIFSQKMKNTATITESSRLSTITWLLLVRENTLSGSNDNTNEFFDDENEHQNDEIESCLDEEIESCPDDETENYSDYDENEMDNTLEEEVFEDGAASIKANTEKSQEIPPSWSAFNSLLSKKSPVSYVAVVPPLFTKSPTNIYILLEILQRAQHISVLTVGEGKKPLITLDGDLFARAVNLKDYKKWWIIRLGSLHQIIAALKTLGKYIEDSGIDSAWEISGIYGSATVRQIIEGRHIYRGIEAHTTTLMALFSLNASSLLTKKDIERLNSILSSISSRKHPNFADDMKKVQLSLVESGLMEKLTSNQNTNDVTKFLHNYMNQVINLLTFISATRISHWKQHLASSQDMLKYFHAHDQLNYARWLIIYLADMLELETTDPEAWKFLNDGNFTVTKSGIPFTSIDPDHAIEQVHRELKGKGGFIGTTQNDKLLERFALTVPMLSMFAEKFKSYTGIKTSHTQLHHELVGNAFKSRLQKSKLLSTTLSKEGNPFLFTDLCNFVNFSVPSDEIKKNVANRDELGEKAYQKFWKDRISDERTVPFWDTLHKNNFKLFSSQFIVVKDNKSSRITTLKEERNLYVRLLAVSKTRSEVNLQTAIGEYEFCSYPPSNFTPSGKLIKHNDKFKLFKLINALPKGKYEHELSHTSCYSLLFIDGMRIVNEIKKTDKIKTAQDLANEFLARLNRLTKNICEVRLMFDEYVEHSLKNVTRENRNLSKKSPIHFHVNDSTPIGNIQQFLAHWKTKKELTKYLGDKVIQCFQHSDQKVLVAYQKKFIANCSLEEILTLPCMLTGEHNLEEADQLISLNCIDVAKNVNRKQTITIYASDTDILVNAISWYMLIPANIQIRRLQGQLVQVGDFFERLGELRAKALIGWYTIYETDMTGGLAGKGITKHFDAFMHADDEMLQAFVQFGETSTVSEFIIKQVERYICYLYMKSYSKNICELRYSLALQDKEGKQLPPTLGTLIPHIKRSFYMSFIWKNTVQSLQLTISPCDFGWFLDDNNEYQPVRCDNPSAPKALLIFKKCGCLSLEKRCSKVSCTCLKNGFKCTDLCKCEELCKNRPDEPTCSTFNENVDLFI